MFILSKLVVFICTVKPGFVYTHPVDDRIFTVKIGFVYICTVITGFMGICTVKTSLCSFVLSKLVLCTRDI